MADNSIRLFGFELKRTKKEDNIEKLKSVVAPQSDDGAARRKGTRGCPVATRQ